MFKKIIKSFILYILMWLGANSLFLKDEIRVALIMSIITYLIILIPNLFKKDVVIPEISIMNNIKSIRTFIGYSLIFIGLNSFSLKIDNWKVFIFSSIIYLIIFAFDYFKKDESIE